MNRVEQPLALDGGPPVRTTPMTSGKRWGFEELREVLDVFESGKLFRFGGEKVPAFEQAFAETFGVRHAVASTSGTAAIHIAIGMVNPDPGDEIIVAPITDGGSVVPILYQGALPVFADSDPETFNVDPAEIERRITSRTRAILVVHLLGNPCDMEAVMEIGGRFNLPIIEDCSQAHGAEYRGRLCGTIGDIGCFSLQASKHITTGEGGMTITNRDDYGERGALFMDKGWTRQPGWGPRTYAFLAPNYRMPEIVGAVGCAQIRKLASIVDRRNHNGDLLNSLITDVPGVHPQTVLAGCKHTYWSWALTVNPEAPFDADTFASALSAEGIGAGAHYIGEPIFLCMDAVCKKITLGESQFPFSYPGAAPVEYNEDTCPRTRDLLQRWVSLGISEFQTEPDIEDMAIALRKVSLGLHKRAQRS
ncbi:MAG: DegT/DnrJ/EryC1/StrS family aminotransferase [Armatimonadetes bacterium]|nr:DegT/DnrJ/EryC1/StrS family aminotransferase [Armatimonadota bacterium]